jgi:hypothetical protein
VHFQKIKHKVPPPYSRADNNARSLNGRRDDEREKEAMTPAHIRPLPSIIRLRLGMDEHLKKFRRGLFESNFQLC